MDKAVPAQLPYIAASRVEAEPQLLVNVSNGTGEGLSACIPRRLSMKFTHHVIHAARVLGLAAETSTMLFDEPAQVGPRDRQSVGSGKSVSVRVDLGGSLF